MYRRKALRGKPLALQPGSFLAPLASPSSSPALAMLIIANAGFPGAGLLEKLIVFNVNVKNFIQHSSRG